jgi:ABC-type Na+ transport system ATPase subunit NatA
VAKLRYGSIHPELDGLDVDAQRCIVAGVAGLNGSGRRIVLQVCIDELSFDEQV